MPEKATGKDRLKEITDSIKTGIGTIDPVFLSGDPHLRINCFLSDHKKQHSFSNIEGRLPPIL